MKTIWIEDDYLLECALAGSDPVLLEVAQCRSSLSGWALYIAGSLVPVIQERVVAYLLSCLSELPRSYLRRVAGLGVHLREIERVHPLLSCSCRAIMRQSVALASTRLEAGSPVWRSYWLERAGDGYDVWVRDEWGIASSPVSTWP